jgi:two-component system response regulator YesN
MYTVLIVDDEEPVLDSYAFLLGDGMEGFALAGKARSGYEAIKLMYELRPDVVFMDINMPGLDGLETIAEVHGKFPDTVFVLSTAYERFDLARRAIPLGVHAYLVKPITRKVFADTLAGIRKDLDERRTERIPSHEDIPVDAFVRDVAMGTMDVAKWAAYRERFDLDIARCFVCLASVDSEQDNRFDGINARLELKYRFIFSVYLGIGVYLFRGDADPSETERQYASIAAELLPEPVMRFIGVGSVHEGKDVSLSYAEAFDALMSKKNSTDVRLRERMRIVQIRRGLGVSPPENIIAVFRAYWEEVFVSYDFIAARAKMVALFILLVDDCTGCYQSYTNDPPPFFPSEEIMGLASIEAWRDWSDGAFGRLIQLASLKRRGNFPLPLVKAISYVDGNFHLQIQLSDAADAASVSSAYLSRLFGEHLGTTFVDYLTELRIEKAEKLIRENSMNIKEVSFAVGYQDPNYFSKIFRKMTGMSPSMYAERNRYETGE